MRKSFVAVILLSTILVGCGQSPEKTGPVIVEHSNTTQSQKPLHEQTEPNSLPPVENVKPTSVQIKRKEHGKLEELDMTIRNEPTVRQLYSDLRSLPLFPSRTMYCPLDTGVRYTLTFKRGNKVVLVAVANPTGCQSIKLSNGETVWGVSNAGKPFWTLIANSIGLPNDSYLGGEKA